MQLDFLSYVTREGAEIGVEVFASFDADDWHDYDNPAEIYEVMETAEPHASVPLSSISKDDMQRLEEEAREEAQKLLDAEESQNEAMREDAEEARREAIQARWAVDPPKTENA